ncbi:MAG: acyltransferase family protein [Halobacteriota archaeon]
MPLNKRLIELDALRAAAIGLVLLTHLAAYVRAPAYVRSIEVINYGFPLAQYGLFLFVFISGFALCHNNVVIRSRKDAIGFLKKRAIRIYPLYWVALAAFLALGILPRANLSAVIIHICGAQGLLSPQFVTPVQTLWFVGVILLYYSLYPIFAALSYNAKYMVSAMLGFFFVFAILHLAFNIIDARFFLYYWIFIAGIVARKYNLLYGRDASKSLTAYATILFLVAVLAIVSLPTVAPTLPHVYVGGLITPLHIQTVLLLAFDIVLGLLFIYASFNIARLTLPLMSKTTLKLILAISLSSYCVYLFHDPFLFLIRRESYATHISALAQNILIVCGIPLLFLLGYALQVTANSLVRKFTEPSG